MCTTACLMFGIQVLEDAEMRGKRVVEFGACAGNGSLRQYIERFAPASYLGLDLVRGPGVDLQCRAEDAAGVLGEGGFDIVVSTEMLEHVRDWRGVVDNLKRVCRPDGVVLLTTRSLGFVYHPLPYDYWRFEPEDLRAIFADFEILSLERDWVAPGVLLKARRRPDMPLADLSGIALYSVAAERRVVRIEDADPVGWRARRLWVKDKASYALHQVRRAITGWS